MKYYVLKPYLLLAAVLLAAAPAGMLQAQQLAVYVDFGSYEMIGLSVDGQDPTHVWYSNGNKPLARLAVVKDQVQMGTDGQPDEFGSREIRVRFAGGSETYTLYTDNGPCAGDLRVKNPDGTEQSFDYFTSVKSPQLAGYQQLCQPALAGFYGDMETKELLMVRTVTGSTEVWYSNGTKPFVQMAVLSQELSRCGIKAAFKSSPGQVYSLYLVSNGMHLKLKCTGPDGKTQHFGDFWGIDTPTPAQSPADLVQQMQEMGFCKPVTYLYPTDTTSVTVQLRTQAPLAVSWPQYPQARGWQLKACPDGTLINPAMPADTYSYLYWETEPAAIPWALDSATVFEGKEAWTALKKALVQMGFRPREYNEFLVYWAPVLRQHKWVRVTWAIACTRGPQDCSNKPGKQYARSAELIVTPAPAETYRLMMLYKPLKVYEDSPAQHLPRMQRKGFHVVEWGGARLP